MERQADHLGGQPQGWDRDEQHGREPRVPLPELPLADRDVQSAEQERNARVEKQKQDQIWRYGRVAYRAGLLIRRPSSKAVREFESHYLRQIFSVW